MGSNPTLSAILLNYGEMPERPKGRDWKSRVRRKRTVGSNPTLSAINYSRSCSGHYIFLFDRAATACISKPMDLSKQSGLVVLGGVLAVPCSPQSAIAGLNTQLRLVLVRADYSGRRR